jgi:sugar lactone lactonase YvrE
MKWFAGVLPSLSFSLAKGEIMGPGVLLVAASPIVSLISGMQQLTSDFSNPVAVYGSVNPVASADEVEVDPSKGFVYHSDAMKQVIYRSEWAGEQFMGQIMFADTGFKGGPVGLAVDSLGSVYTDNQSSDAQFGGRIFRYYPNGFRELAGTVNYFSQLLMFANPVSVSKMTMGPNNHLFVADEDCGCIKDIAVNLAIDPKRIVGQNFATLNPYNIPVLDMHFANNRGLSVLTSTNVQWIPFDSTTNSGGTPVNYLDLTPFNANGFGGLTVDGYGNVYISQKGATAGAGRVLMFPADTCSVAPDCSPLVIMDKLNVPGAIELSKDGRSLFIATQGGKVEKHIFGVSGYVKDFFGTPLGGALVSLQTEPRGYTKAVRTDSNGYFFYPELFRADLIVPYLDITVEYDGKTQVFLTQMGQPNLEAYGHTIRNITFSP